MALLQPTMQGQDDLVALFARHLNLDPSQALQEMQQMQQLQEQQLAQQQQQQQQPAQQTQPPSQPITYISMHYNHSAHIPRQVQQQQQQQTPPARPASEPPQSEHQATEAILSSRGIDPSALSSSQLQLFKEADEQQKLRLLELWSICPPTNSRDNPALAWGNSSLELEEQLARQRYEQKTLIKSPDGNVAMSLDGTPVPSTTSTFQGGDGRWLNNPNNHSYMEPYMMSGYEELARREYEASAAAAAGPGIMSPNIMDVSSPTYSSATDPVYNTTGIDWALRRQQAMEDQYGAYSQQACRMEL